VKRKLRNGVNAFLAALIGLFFRLLSLVPRRWMAAAAKPLGDLWRTVDRRHRGIATKNVSLAYRLPEDDPFVRSTVKQCFRHLATVALELGSLYRINENNLDDHVVMHGVEHLKEASAQGKGVLFLTGHYGNWEIMALAAGACLGVPLHITARPLDFVPLDIWLARMRERTGNTLVDKNRAAAKIAALLRKNGNVAIMLDQNASWYDGVYIPFFGRVACTNKGMALFALRTGAAVVPAFSRRRPDGRYDVEIHPPLYVERTGDLKADVVRETERFTRVIEEEVRKDPSQWMWVHRRWRIKGIPEHVRRRMDLPPGFVETEI